MLVVVIDPAELKMAINKRPDDQNFDGLTLNHGDGSCSSIKDKRVFMCFNDYSNLCRQMTELPSSYLVPHTELPKTTFHHIGGPICASESKNSK